MSFDIPPDTTDKRIDTQNLRKLAERGSRPLLEDLKAGRIDRAQALALGDAADKAIAANSWAVALATLLGGFLWFRYGRPILNGAAAVGADSAFALIIFGLCVAMVVVLAVRLPRLVNSTKVAKAVDTAYRKGGAGSAPPEKEPPPIPPALESVIQSLYEKTKQPTIRLTPREGASSVFATKLGGAPYLPPGFAWPAEETQNGPGAPLRFLAQLNFEELWGLQGFPQGGMLQFYAAADDLYGADFDDPTRQAGFRVVYHP